MYLDTKTSMPPAAPAPNSTPGPNRAQRRAMASKSRRGDAKGLPFHRVTVLSVETGAHPRDDRIVYRHPTKGLMDRRYTRDLIDHLLRMS